MTRDFFKKIPAGNMMVPLLIASLINTFFGQGLAIGKFTSAILTDKSTATLMALNLMAAGSQIDFKTVASVFKRASVISIARIGTGILIVVLVNKFFGPQGIFNISILALACGLLNHNNSVFISLNINYGDRIDRALGGFGSLVTGPVIAMVILGMGGLAEIPLLAIIDSFSPVALGIFLGHFIRGSREVFAKSQQVFIPFLGFGMGSAIDLRDVFRAGFSGPLLAFIVIFIVGSMTVLFDILINKRPGHAGWAMSTTGANAVAVPSMIAEIDPSFAPYLGLATAQVASSVVITIIITPIITDLWARKFERKV